MRLWGLVPSAPRFSDTDDGTVRSVEDAFSHAANPHSLQGAAAVRAHDDEVDAVAFRSPRRAKAAIASPGTRMWQDWRASSSSGCAPVERPHGTSSSRCADCAWGGLHTAVERAVSELR